MTGHLGFGPELRKAARMHLSPKDAMDARWPGLLEQTTASFDARLLGVGGGPYRETSSSFLSVPAAPVDAPPALRPRFLFRLCGVAVPDSGFVILRGMRLFLEIGLNVVSGLGTYPVARPVVTPGWQFTDGNVSYHLTFEKGNVRSDRTASFPVHPPGTSNQLHATGPALLFGTDAFTPYVPPAGGIPPGEPVNSYGSFYDGPAHFPWDALTPTMHCAFTGPGRLCLYASVLQTLPTSDQFASVKFPPIADVTDNRLAGLRPEDLFVSLNSNSAYTRIAGSILVETGSLIALGSGGLLGAAAFPKKMCEACQGPCMDPRHDAVREIAAQRKADLPADLLRRLVELLEKERTP